MTDQPIDEVKNKKTAARAIYAAAAVLVIVFAAYAPLSKLLLDMPSRDPNRVDPFKVVPLLSLEENNMYDTELDTGGSRGETPIFIEDEPAETSNSVEAPHTAVLDEHQESLSRSTIVTRILPFNRADSSDKSILHGVTGLENVPGCLVNCNSEKQP